MTEESKINLMTGMFWRAKSPLEADDEAWQLDCWGWLLRNLGGLESLLSTPLVLPTRAFFQPSSEKGHAFAVDVYRQVAARFGIDPSTVPLVAQSQSVDARVGAFAVVQNAPQAPLGTYREDESGAAISYDPKLVDRPKALIATLAHELCHARLFRIEEEPPGGPEMEEFATDLAVTFFGFGIFNANEASRFTAYSDAGTGAQGWAFEGGGYLSPAERAFALAMFLALKTENSSAALEHLDSGPMAYFRKAEKYLAANPDLIRRIGSCA